MPGFIRRLLVILGWVLLPLAIYAVAALVLGHIPVNSDFRSAKSGIDIAVVDNGIHTDILLPVTATAPGTSAVLDWRAQLPDDTFASGPIGPNSYLMFGWGHRDFYLRTPQWSDLTATTAVRALLGLGGSVVHVSHWPHPKRWSGENVVWLTLTPAAYARLYGFIDQALARDPNGKPRPIIEHTYGANDAFFEAVGDYGPISTCNQWTGRALTHAGVRTGLWTPNSGAVMSHLRHSTLR